jgi:hypothetical protein
MQLSSLFIYVLIQQAKVKLCSKHEQIRETNKCMYANKKREETCLMRLPEDGPKCGPKHVSSIK